MSAAAGHTGRQGAPLHTRTRWRGSEVTIALRGELDCATAPLLSSRLTSALARQPGRVVLDLAALTFIDCSGVTPIIRARRRLPPATPLVLRSPVPAVRSFLTMTGLDRGAGLHCA